MRRCSIFVTHLKNEYIEVEFNKARCFCSFRCLSNPYSCTITSLIFRTQGIRAQVSSGASFRAYRSVRKFPRAHLSGSPFIRRAHLSGSPFIRRALINGCFSFSIVHFVSNRKDLPLLQSIEDFI